MALGGAETVVCGPTAVALLARMQLGAARSARTVSSALSDCRASWLGHTRQRGAKSGAARARAHRRAGVHLLGSAGPNRQGGQPLRSGRSALLRSGVLFPCPHRATPRARGRADGVEDPHLYANTLKT